MAKDKFDKEKKRNKEKKRSEADGVHKKKKEKKQKDIAIPADAEEKELPTEVLVQPDVESKETAPNGDVSISKTTLEEVNVRPVGSLVPFANPLVDDKVAKKVLKSVKKGVLMEFLHIHSFGLHPASTRSARCGDGTSSAYRLPTSGVCFKYYIY